MGTKWPPAPHWVLWRRQHPGAAHMLPSACWVALSPGAAMAGTRRRVKTTLKGKKHSVDNLWQAFASVGRGKVTQGGMWKGTVTARVSQRSLHALWGVGAFGPIRAVRCGLKFGRQTDNISSLGLKLPSPLTDGRIWFIWCCQISSSQFL